MRYGIKTKLYVLIGLLGLMLLISCGGGGGSTNDVSADIDPPTNATISINGGVTNTTSRYVTLAFSASDNIGVTKYIVSESSLINAYSVGWVEVPSATSFSASGIAYTLSSGNGTKTVNVRFMDSTGNISWTKSSSIVLISSTGTNHFTLPDTGQTTSYTSTYGEDASYSIHPPSYTDNGNGTITDNVTSLMWQKEDDGIRRDWTSAGTYCDGLTLGGYSDWRLPTRIELFSIVDSGTYDPAINSTYFSNVRKNVNGYVYWTSTASGLIVEDAWYVAFYSGYEDDDMAKGLNINNVRCVRGSAYPTQSFTDNGNSTITDNVTGLMWQQQDDGITKTWESALAYCEGLSLGNHTDWRLPNIKELETLIDASGVYPLIDPLFIGTQVSISYWSSTTIATDTSLAWGTCFASCDLPSDVKTASHYVRCVR